MKLLYFLAILFLFTSASAAVVNSMLMNGSDYKLLHICNSNNLGYVYAENYQHQKILIFKSSHPYPPHSIFSSDQIEGTDILGILFDCDQNICTRFLNRRTNKLSKIFPDILDYNDKKDVIAYYIRNKGLVIIDRAFKTCRNPLTFTVNLTNGYEFGNETKFLSNGDLKLGYETETGKYIIKVIPINFKQFLSNCSFTSTRK